MFKPKDFVFDSYDVTVITDLISHLSSMLSFGVSPKTHSQHDFWAFYYHMACNAFNRMSSNLKSRCDITED